MTGTFPAVFSGIMFPPMLESAEWTGWNGSEADLHNRQPPYVSDADEDRDHLQADAGDPVADRAMGAGTGTTRSLVLPTPGRGQPATLLHALGIDHKRLAFHHEGRDDTLTDVVVSGARVIPELLA